MIILLRGTSEGKPVGYNGTSLQTGKVQQREAAVRAYPEKRVRLSITLGASVRFGWFLAAPGVQLARTPEWAFPGAFAGERQV